MTTPPIQGSPALSSRLYTRGIALAGALYNRLPSCPERISSAASRCYNVATRLGGAIRNTNPTLTCVAIGATAYVVASPAIATGLATGMAVNIVLKALHGAASCREHEEVQDREQEMASMMVSGIVTTMGTCSGGIATLAGAWIVRTTGRAHQDPNWPAGEFPKPDLERAVSLTRQIVSPLADIPDNNLGKLALTGVAYVATNTTMGQGLITGLTLGVAIKALNKEERGQEFSAFIPAIAIMAKMTGWQGALATLVGRSIVLKITRDGPNPLEEHVEALQEHLEALPEQQRTQLRNRAILFTAGAVFIAYQVVSWTALSGSSSQESRLH